MFTHCQEGDCKMERICYGCYKCEPHHNATKPKPWLIKHQFKVG